MSLMGCCGVNLFINEYNKIGGRIKTISLPDNQQIYWCVTFQLYEHKPTLVFILVVIGVAYFISSGPRTLYFLGATS